MSFAFWRSQFLSRGLVRTWKPQEPAFWKEIWNFNFPISKSKKLTKNLGLFKHNFRVGLSPIIFQLSFRPI